MPYLIAFFTIGFLLASFIVTPVPIAHEVFSGYVATQINFIASNNIVFLLAYIIYIASNLRSKKIKETYSRGRKIFHFSVQFLEAGFVSFFLTFGILLLIGVLELNIFAVLINSNPHIVGIVDDTKNVVKALQNTSIPPDIIASNTEPYKEVAAVGMTTTGTNQYYGKYILSAIPGFLIFPVKRDTSSLLLIDNTLIVTRLDAKDLQQISPVMGFLLVKQYFPDRGIKTAPHISIMNQDNYNVFRKEDIAKKSRQLDADIQKVETYISTTSAKIEEEKKELADNQASVISKNALLNAQYNTCLSAGYYRQGTFYRYHTDAECQKIHDQIAPVKLLSSADLDALQTDVQSKQDLLTTYQEYQKFFTYQKNVTKVTTLKVSAENGVFNPPDLIKVNLETSNPQAVADYFETVTHEYLHYASFISSEHVFADTFFEEALTEYFARQAIKDAFHTSTNLGYPVQVKIISEMMKRIPEVQFADVYFSKDEAQLEETLDITYGKGFYSKNEALFELLQYAASPQQKLKVGNQIMKLIGGPVLQEKDLYSTFSSVE